jgi:predicted ABC-type ATPase
VNADVIAQGLSAFAPEQVAQQAGQIMIARLQELAQERVDFAFETTLSGRAHLVRIRELLATGYQVHVYYFWVPSADMSVARVALRVQQGGHDVPEATIRQRYARSVANFIHLYRPIVTTWQSYDSTAIGHPRCVAEGGLMQPDVVHDPMTWQQILEVAPS